MSRAGLLASGRTFAAQLGDGATVAASGSEAISEGKIAPDTEKS